MSKYDDIMAHLHPKVLISKIEVPHDTARGRYVLKSSIVKTHQEFEEELISYVRHPGQLHLNLSNLDIR